MTDLEKKIEELKKDPRFKNVNFNYHNSEEDDKIEEIFKKELEGYNESVDNTEEPS